MTVRETGIMSDIPTDNTGPEEDVPVSDAPLNAPPSKRRNIRLRGLDDFARLQRQLAAVDFTALAAARRSIENATSNQIPGIVAAQDSIAKSFGQSVDFTLLAATYKSVSKDATLEAITTAQKRWAESLGNAIDVSALDRALESTKAIASFSTASQALVDVFRQEKELLARIADSARFTLPRFDTTRWIELLDRWIPINLRSVEDLETVASIALDEGLPLSWVPRSEIVLELTEADGPDARVQILTDRRADILDDCEEALASIENEWAVQCGSAIAALRLGADGPGQSHAANIVDSIVLALHGKRGRDLVKERAQDEIDDLPLQVAAENLTLRPLFRAFTGWWPDSGTEPPRHFARHATAHAVGHVGVFAPLPALIAVMLATSLTVQYVQNEATETPSDRGASS
jgi:hypothetical protein